METGEDDSFIGGNKAGRGDIYFDASIMHQK